MLEISIENKNISIEVNQSIEDVIDSSFKIDDIVAAKIDNELVDLSYSIDKNCTIHHGGFCVQQKLRRVLVWV